MKGLTKFLHFVEKSDRRRLIKTSGWLGLVRLRLWLPDSNEDMKIFHPLQAPTANTSSIFDNSSHPQLGSGKLLQLAHFCFLGLCGTLLSTTSVLALPQGGEVQAGQAQINPVDVNRMNILQQSERAVIGWNSFSVGGQERVDFQQPSASSATLNRVTGNASSDIAGRITANGQIMLVNPNGILFTSTAQLDVAGLLATTLDIKNQDFMNGILHFEQVPGRPLSTVENQGQISVKEGGFAALVAPGVVNSGVINARLGKAVLASGTQATLDLYGDGLLSLAVDPALAEQIIGADGKPLNTLVTNSGTINADGGIVTLSAKAGAALVDNVINMNGVIQAQSVENRDGLIVLSGGDTGAVAVSGKVDASGTNPGQTGGTVQVLGEKVALVDGPQINVSGEAGGGTALIGGDYKGQGTVPNAKFTFVGKDAVINADALNSGNGGKVIAWADNTTRFYGTVTASGGKQAGNGGLVETSGKIGLDVNGSKVDTSALKGQVGTWLLDPSDLTIQSSGGDTNVSGNPNFNTLESPAILSEATLETSLESNNVTITTEGGTGGNGDITLDAIVDSDSSNSLTLTSRRFNLTSGSFKLGGNLTFNLNKVNPETNPLVSSIQAAHDAIGTVAGTRTINLGTGTFQGATLTISKDLTLNGAGRDNTFLDGRDPTSGEKTRRVLDITGGTVNLTGVTIQNGNANGLGGGIQVTSGTALNVASGTTLNVDNSRISDNEAIGSGGGIFVGNHSTLKVVNSDISGNKTPEDGGGISSNPQVAGVRGDQRIILNKVTVSGNIAGEAGGGIEHERGGLLEVRDSTVSGNKAMIVDGGGIENDRSTLTVIDSFIIDNIVENPNEDGGGIENDGGSANIMNSTISRNRAGRFGGGIDNKGGTVTVADTTTISNNGATLGGGIHNRNGGRVTVVDSSITGNSAQLGGGIFNSSTPSSSTATVTNSTITGNSAFLGGGIFNQDSATVTNSTITGNFAQFGGGIFNSGSLILQNNSKVFGNTAQAFGGGIYNTGTLTLTNSSVTGNLALFPFSAGIPFLFGNGIFGNNIFNGGTVTITP